jgi:hypothetical protein
MKRLLIFSVCLQLILTFVSCGNPRNKRDSINSNSDNNSNNSKNSSSLEPDIQQIKLDLIGKTIVEPTHELYRSEFKINSKKNIVDVVTKSKRQNENQYMYQSVLTLTDQVNTYQADVVIKYLLKNNEWSFDFLECKNLDIIPTENFNSCIVVKKERYSFSEHLFMYNNCDVALIAEGRIYAWTSDGSKREWQYFAIEVPANGKTDFYYETEADYIIERIERP